MAVVPGTGLSATYYDNLDFTGTSVTRIEKKVFADYGLASPVPSIAPTTYSVRWTGKIKPSFSETYTFHTTADDGVRLWVNHRLIIDDWNTHAPAERAGTVSLEASKRVDIQLEYFNKRGGGLVQLWWSSASQPKSVVPTSRLYPEAQNLASKTDHAFAFAEQQISLSLRDLGGAPGLYPINTKGSGSFGSDGTWSVTGGEAWTSGFFAGAMWEAYKHNPKKAMRLDATAWTQSLANQTTIGDDMGFRINVPFKNFLGSSSESTRMTAANAKYAHWNSTVGMFRSSGGPHATNPSADFAVLLDHSMDMEILYWASRQTRSPNYRDRATAHLLKLAQHFIRADGSTAQLGYFDSSTGAFVMHEKKQGASAASTWSRGQAWAIYAYTAGYRETGDAALLATAKKVAEYFIANMPADGVPFWDFTAPSTYRDTSAAAIAASGLFELARVAPLAADKTRYRAYAELILNSLLSPAYLAEGSTSRGVLLHGAAHVPRKNPLPDNSLIYGDYYLLEAMNRFAGVA
jgi:unsaturated chondroitin disaccharide hydrolase